jgi:hypothetical protein
MTGRGGLRVISISGGDWGKVSPTLYAPHLSIDRGRERLLRPMIALRLLTKGHNCRKIEQDMGWARWDAILVCGESSRPGSKAKKVLVACFRSSVPTGRLGLLLSARTSAILCAPMFIRCLIH